MLKLVCLFALICCCPTQLLQAQEIKTVQEAYDSLQSGPLTGERAAAMTRFVEAKSRSADLSTGSLGPQLQPLDDGSGYAFLCLRAPGDAQVKVAAERGRQWPMTRVGDSDLWVWAEKFPAQSSVHYQFEVNGRRFVGARAPRFGFEGYERHPDSIEQPGVPRGQLIDMGKHVGQKYFPGAERDWWIYVPSQYSPDKAAETRLVIFNDGRGFAIGEGNVCTMLDNLIHQGKVPLTIAVFVTPGRYPANQPGKEPRSNRGDEYDTCTPRFANFLDEEILPLVREKYPFSADPWDHAICGSSSGGSCAFTAAWHRNDLFRRVITFVGSFCDFRGVDDYPQPGQDATIPADAFGPWKTAHDYPGLIRKTRPHKEIKIYMQEGENDLDNRLGNWPLANKQMEAALLYAGYDHKVQWGTGMHSNKHGMSILPDMLVWLWKDEPKSSQ